MHLPAAVAVAGVGPRAARALVVEREVAGRRASASGRGDAVGWRLSVVGGGSVANCIDERWVRRGPRFERARWPAAWGVWRQTSCIWTLFATPPVVGRWFGGVWREATICRTFLATPPATPRWPRLCLAYAGNFDTTARRAPPDAESHRHCTTAPTPDPSLIDAVENAANHDNREAPAAHARSTGDPWAAWQRRRRRFCVHRSMPGPNRSPAKHAEPADACARSYPGCACAWAGRVPSFTVTVRSPSPRCTCTFTSRPGSRLAIAAATSSERTTS
jgi:hypothetical protein